MGDRHSPWSHLKPQLDFAATSSLKRDQICGSVVCFKLGGFLPTEAVATPAMGAVEGRVHRGPSGAATEGRSLHSISPVKLTPTGRFPEATAMRPVRAARSPHTVYP